MDAPRSFQLDYIKTKALNTGNRVLDDLIVEIKAAIHDNRGSLAPNLLNKFLKIDKGEIEKIDCFFVSKLCEYLPHSIQGRIQYLREQFRINLQVTQCLKNILDWEGCKNILNRFPNIEPGVITVNTCLLKAASWQECEEILARFPNIEPDVIMVNTCLLKAASWQECEEILARFPNIQSDVITVNTCLLKATSWQECQEILARFPNIEPDVIMINSCLNVVVSDQSLDSQTREDIIFALLSILYEKFHETMQRGYVNNALFKWKYPSEQALERMQKEYPELAGIFRQTSELYTQSTKNISLSVSTQPQQPIQQKTSQVSVVATPKSSVQSPQLSRPTAKNGLPDYIKYAGMSPGLVAMVQHGALSRELGGGNIKRRKVGGRFAREVKTL